MKRKHLDDDDANESVVDNLDEEDGRCYGSDQSEDDDSEDDQRRGNCFQLNKVLSYQKGTTLAENGDVKVTPFNLEEELEEGEFDASGNYIFKKAESDDEDKDAWADSIDWNAIENKQSKEDHELTEKPRHEDNHSLKKSKSDSASQERPEPARDRISCYKEMLRIMRSDETVQKTIRRLGNSVPKARRPANKPKSIQNPSPDQDPNLIAETKRKLDRMIELAHNLLEDGDTDIYQKTYEDLEEAIN